MVAVPCPHILALDFGLCCFSILEASHAWHLLNPACVSRFLFFFCPFCHRRQCLQSLHQRADPTAWWWSWLSTYLPLILGGSTVQMARINKGMFLPALTETVISCLDDFHQASAQSESVFLCFGGTSLWTEPVDLVAIMVAEGVLPHVLGRCSVPCAVCALGKLLSLFKYIRTLKSSGWSWGRGGDLGLKLWMSVVRTWACNYWASM